MPLGAAETSMVPRWLRERDLIQNTEVARCAMRKRACERLIRDYAERVYFGPAIERFTAYLLREHAHRRAKIAHLRSAHTRGQRGAEVAGFDGRWPGKHDVRGLDIAVRDAEAMRAGKSAAALAADFHDALDRR